MTISAKVIADSINPDGKRITTIQCKYPRFIHAQGKTHRKLTEDQASVEDVSVMDEKEFSRNAQSSRACPFKKMLEEIEGEMSYPIWTMNKGGMQGDLVTDQDMIEKANEIVLGMFYSAKAGCKILDKMGFHKQNINRYLEPFMHINVIITATEWENFFNLRLDDDAQIEIQKLAREMKNAMNESTPRILNWGDWHMPYALDHLPNGSINGIKSSVAVSARVSLNNHDGTERTLEKDIKTHDRLLATKTGQFHASPFEHPARAMRGRFANYDGWCSYRWEIENERRN